jgi:FMN-dependent NADH-azoreductase
VQALAAAGARVLALAAHGLALIGLQPRLIVAELTLAEVNRAMAEFISLARKSRADAERAVDELWRSATMDA